MKAVVVTPKQAGSGRVEEVPYVATQRGEVLDRVHEVSVDGTAARSGPGR